MLNPGLNFVGSSSSLAIPLAQRSQPIRINKIPTSASMTLPAVHTASFRDRPRNFLHDGLLRDADTPDFLPVRSAKIDTYQRGHTDGAPAGSQESSRNARFTLLALLRHALQNQTMTQSGVHFGKVERYVVTQSLNTA